MAVDYNSSANTFFNTIGQAAQAAVLNQEQISASMAGAGRAVFNARTGEWFEVEGTGSSARYVKRGQEGGGVTSSTARASIANRTNMLGFNESDITKVKQAQSLNSNNYRKVKEIDVDSGAEITHVYGTYVYLSTSSSFSSVNIPIPNIGGKRTPAILRVRDKQFIELGDGLMNMSHIIAHSGGASMYSGRDGSTTKYWHVFHYEFWSA